MAIQQGKRPRDLNRPSATKLALPECSISHNPWQRAGRLGISAGTGHGFEVQGGFVPGGPETSAKVFQKQLQAILGEPQPRVSELLNGKVARKSVDKLLDYAGRLGLEDDPFPQTRKAYIQELATTPKLF